MKSLRLSGRRLLPDDKSEDLPIYGVVSRPLGMGDSERSENRMSDLDEVNREK